MTVTRDISIRLSNEELNTLAAAQDILYRYCSIVEEYDVNYCEIERNALEALAAFNNISNEPYQFMTKKEV